MRKHCGNCANHRKETNQFSDECGKCVASILPNGEQTDPSHWKAKPQTNADRIRAMSDEELAKQFSHTSICEQKYPKCMVAGEDCVECLLEWLKQPVEVEDGQA